MVGERPRILILGATGYLGPALVAAFERDCDVTAGGRALVDLADGAAVARLVDRLAPHGVVNAAAVNPSNPGDLEAVNVGGAGAVARAAARTRLVHISTDVVHDGTAAPYADDAEPSPLGDYGTSKAHGEAAVAAAHPDAALVRSSLIWDPARIDVPTAGFAQRLAEGLSLSLWTDVLRQPILAVDLAALVRVLVTDARSVAGPLNAGGSQVLSRAEFGQRLLAHFDIAGRERVTTAAAPPGVATDLRLRTARAAALGIDLRGVDEALDPAAGRRG